MKKMRVLHFLFLLLTLPTLLLDAYAPRAQKDITNYSLDEYLVQKADEEKREKPSNMLVGRLYYETLLDKATTKKWAVPIIFDYSIATK